MPIHPFRSGCHVLSTAFRLRASVSRVAETLATRYLAGFLSPERGGTDRWRAANPFLMAGGMGRGGSGGRDLLAGWLQCWSACFLWGRGDGMAWGGGCLSVGDDGSRKGNVDGGQRGDEGYLIPASRTVDGDQVAPLGRYSTPLSAPWTPQRRSQDALVRWCRFFGG